MQAATVSHARIWTVAAVVVAAVLWFLGDIVLPFVIGAGLAYFLDPLVEALVRRRLPRWAAVATIVLSTLAVVALAILALIPAMIGQANALVAATPALFTALSTTLTERFPDLMMDNEGLRNLMVRVGEWAAAQGGQVLAQVMTSARSLIGVVLLLVVVPVVTIYMLLDWPRMIATIDSLLPQREAPTIRRLLAEIDRSISAYVRGMGSVCLAMAAWYGIGLMAVGLQFGLLIGAVAGILTFIPYVGAMVGGVLAIGLGLWQFWGDWLSVGLVVAVFASGQFVEGNIITPRVLGQAVGVHPVWLLFALSLMGALFGLVGMLIAVPMAAAAAVLVRHGSEVYRESALYRGTPGS